MSTAAKGCLELLVNAAMEELRENELIPVECRTLISDAKKVWPSGASAVDAAVRAIDSVSDMNAATTE